MKTIDQINRDNLELLAKELGGVVKLADKLDRGPSQVSQWLNGSLNSGTGKPRGMRPATNRYIESKCGKPEGWMDADHIDPGVNSRVRMVEDNVLPGPDMRGKLPLISWVKAGDLCESPDSFHPGDAEDWIDCPVPHSKSAFCLLVSGDSMDGEGGYRDGEIIFVDPEVAATPGRDVVVRTADGKMTFKRLKQDTEGLYLFGINGKKIIRIPENTHICGVVIFSGLKR